MPRGSPKKKAARSTSRGRKAVKSPATPVAAVYSMEFDEGEKVMAKWPGTNLYFNAKVTYVRDDDNEYDVQYEDGTIFTIKAKDVKKAFKAEKKKTPSRSRSRGRSPGRKTTASPSRTVSRTASQSQSVTRRSTRTSTVAKAPATPTRHSARIAAARIELSDDEGSSSAKRSVSRAARSVRNFNPIAYVKSMSFEWVGVLFFMALGPFVLVSLHKLCDKSSCKPTLPFDKLPKTLAAYWDRNAIAAYLAFAMLIRLTSLMPIGATVRTMSGRDVRMNGFVSLLLVLAAMPVLVYKKVDLSFVYDKFFYLMTSSLILAALTTLLTGLISRFNPGRKSNINPRGNTGNPIVDFFYGRELHFFFAKGDLKLQAFRVSMIGLALLNVTMVVNFVMKNNVSNFFSPAVVAAAFQVIYALDAMFFEEYYFFTHDAMNTGCGFSLISGYLSYPFLPTLITRYLIDRNPTMEWYYLAGIVLLNALGYIIFRASETQRCEFAKDPHSAAVKHLETLPSVGGKKLLISGWWGIVRHPNYLGEILIQWSWVLPAACRAGRVDLLIYYLPIFTTLILLVRCYQQNAKNKRRYGAAWDSYCSKVSGNLIPKVF